MTTRPYPQLSTPEPIGILGAGYVGLVTGACLASLGHQVTIRDIDADKVDALNAGRAPIYEPGLDGILAKHRERLTYSLDMRSLVRDARLLFVAVGTPPSHSGDADLSAVRNVIDDLARLGAQPDHTLIMKSTVPPGTGRRLRTELNARGLGHVGYVSNPEFLREGNGIADFMHPDRIVIGSDDPTDPAALHAGDRVAALYAPLDAPIVRTSVTSAEMIKYASNAFLATKISFINEIANVCEEVGADVDVVARGMGMDPRIGPHFLRAGIGYGGSCFPKDVAALKQVAGNSGYHFQLLTAVVEVNDLQKRRVINRLKKHLGSLEDKIVSLLGLTFKPNTDDVRESASLVLAARLIAEGARVRAYDPLVGADDFDHPQGIDFCPTAEAAIDGADAIVLVTEWPQLVNLDWPSLAPTMRQALFVDGRNALDPESMRSAGYTYWSVGRP